MNAESDEIVWRADTEDGGSVWVHANGEWGHDGGALTWALDGMAQHIAALEKERDAALADNAAMVRTMEHAAGHLRHTYGHHAQGYRLDPELVSRAIRLLEEVSRHHPGAALLEEHRKALVRARNEGLEEADAKILKTAEPPAYFREHHPDHDEYEAALSGYSVGVNHALDTIRAMMQPASAPPVTMRSRRKR